MRDAGPGFLRGDVVRTANATSAKAGRAKAIVSDDGVLHGFVGGSAACRGRSSAPRLRLAGREPARLSGSSPRRMSAAQSTSTASNFTSRAVQAAARSIFSLNPCVSPSALSCAALAGGRKPGAAGAWHGYRVIAAVPAEAHGEIPGASDYVEGFAIEGLDLDARDAVVVSRRKAGVTAKRLAAALKSPASYVGMVGSRKKIAKLRNELAGHIPATRLAALHGPAGLDIGAIEPEEIATSILGEMVSERRLKNREQERFTSTTG